MVKKVIKKQQNAIDCFVCGKENDSGLKAEFFELEDGTVVGLATAQSFHQSYPHTVHGGVSTALLDETLGRSIKTTEPETWGVTLEMNVKFKLPIPYDEQIICVGRVTENGGKVFYAEGEVLLSSGEVAAVANGVFYKMSAERLIAMGSERDMMRVFPCENDPVEIDILEVERVYRQFCT